MKVLIVGANGQIGKQTVEKMVNDDVFTPTAMVRKEEQVKAFQDMGAETVLQDLEGQVEDIAAAAKGKDAVVFAAGSGGHTGADKTMMIDMDGAIKSMEAAERAGVKRFVIVSAIGVYDRNKWMSKAPYYSAAKHYADEWLMRSGLDYTVIRPGGLTNDRGNGQIKVAKEVERGEIPREDVAETILASLKDEGTIGKDFDMISGTDDIADALKRL
ncbi:hypothetical protein JCM19037_2660 [Geomicrobium sp. JCM 19037]|uniref:SDR family oxidoreductase n=1 Tax=unclassified Geomicrobium TaxID=2628951 RepID=UPI00045F23B1|nr:MULTISPECIES: SDR family oxidoreductase [unclassified Geomicrobium]GAK04271.1 hypothetical protein JCM19037_2660 [Geomicrobium sp. JCM 19037]GAK14027.1 hypothetical protein JCM19039_3920 [Geomicrobium sp. JCM 19039]